MQTNAYPVGNLHVRYDRKKRLWEIWNNLDVVEQFERGTEGKRDAFLSAIDEQNKELGKWLDKMIVKNPSLKSRIIRAGTMLVNNHWLPKRKGYDAHGEICRIQSQSDSEVLHSVRSLGGGYLSCTCEDFQFGKAPSGKFGQLYCAHIIAHVIQTKINRQKHLAAGKERINA